jgi:two-component sensor histidine kinase
MENLELDVDTAVPIGLIVNELITNALKYAFPTGTLGKIKLSLQEVEENLLQLSISDNGVGKIVNASPTGTGFGTQLVELLTRQLDGKLTQSVENGTTVTIQFARK